MSNKNEVKKVIKSIFRTSIRQNHFTVYAGNGRCFIKKWASDTAGIRAGIHVCLMEYRSTSWLCFGDDVEGPVIRGNGPTYFFSHDIVDHIISSSNVKGKQIVRFRFVGMPVMSIKDRVIWQISRTEVKDIYSILQNMK